MPHEAECLFHVHDVYCTILLARTFRDLLLTNLPIAYIVIESQSGYSATEMQMADFSIILAHKDLIAGTVRRTVRGISQADHDDLCQDIALALVSKLEGFDPARGSLAGFIGQIAHNLAISWTRSKHRKGISIESESDDGPVTLEPADRSAESPEEALQNAQALAGMRAAILTLSPTLRDFALAMIVADFKPETYSAATGVKLGTVYVRMTKVRQKLAAILAP